MRSTALPPDEVMTTPQACRALGVTRQTLYSWMRKGRIRPWLRAGGGSWLFDRKVVFSLRTDRKADPACNKLEKAIRKNLKKVGYGF